MEELIDSKHKMHPGAEDHGGEKGGKRSSPKKLFKWSDEIRSDITGLFKLVLFFIVVFKRISLTWEAKTSRET